MLKNLFLISLLLLTSLTVSASHTISEAPASADRITEHYQNIWKGILSHICEGNLWVYYDTESNRRVLPKDVICPDVPNGFVATFKHTIAGPRSETTLTWVGTKVFNTVFYMDMFVYIKYDDLYPLLSQDERSDLETMCFLFRNTSMYADNRLCQQGCAAALYNNLKETEHAYFDLPTYSMLTPLVSFQIAQTLLDSVNGPKTFLDKKFRKPLELWNATQKEVHQIADKKFPGEFKDSVVIKAYAIHDLLLQFDDGILRMDFRSGETLYCRTDDFLQALPGWCAQFVPIIYDL